MQVKDILSADIKTLSSNASTAEAAALRPDLTVGTLHHSRCVNATAAHGMMAKLRDAMRDIGRWLEAPRTLLWQMRQASAKTVMAGSRQRIP